MTAEQHRVVTSGPWWVCACGTHGHGADSLKAHGHEIRKAAKAADWKARG